MGSGHIHWLTAKWCPHCADLKRDNAERFRSGEWKSLDVETKKGMKIAQELNVSYIPQCVVEENGKFRKCTQQEEQNLE